MCVRDRDVGVIARVLKSQEQMRITVKEVICKIRRRSYECY